MDLSTSPESSSVHHSCFQELPTGSKLMLLHSLSNFLEPHPKLCTAILNSLKNKNKIKNLKLLKAVYFWRSSYPIHIFNYFLREVNVWNRAIKHPSGDKFLRGCHKREPILPVEQEQVSPADPKLDSIGGGNHLNA